MTPPLAKGVEAAIADRDLWRVPEALSACGETIKLPDAVFEHLLRIPLGLNAFEWRTRWNKAWAAGTTGSAFAMWDRAQPTPRELSYISKGYWKSYQAHYERVTKPYGIFTKAHYERGRGVKVGGKLVSEMTLEEMTAAVGVQEALIDAMRALVLDGAPTTVPQ